MATCRDISGVKRGAVLASLLLGTLLLAGCVTSAAHLVHEGQGSGRSEDTVWCEGDTALDVTLTVMAATGGPFRVQVNDGGGSTVYAQSYAGRDDDAQSLSGSSGMWLLVVERDAAFDGRYEVELVCGNGA